MKYSFSPSAEEIMMLRSDSFADRTTTGKSLQLLLWLKEQQYSHILSVWPIHKCESKLAKSQTGRTCGLFTIVQGGERGFFKQYFFSEV